MTIQLCKKNQYGYCKYGDNCRYRHIVEKCETKNCNVFDCERRHPKICNYIRDYGQCKFTTYCKYDHDKPNNIKETFKKIETLEKKIDNLQAGTKVNLGKEVDRKIEAFESKLAILVHIIEEKDSTINKLEKKINSIEKVFDNKLLGIEENLKKVMENNKSLHNLLKSENDQLKCDDCEFTTTSKKGLKTHIKRKHTEKFPIQCERCDKELKNEHEMKNHIITHTYKYENSELKCEECGFTGKNDWSMQIHHGKCHSKNIECGLCEFIAKDNECLEMHLKTCETYECKHCEYVAKTISDMKRHIAAKKNECGSSCIFHVKIDRNNDNAADWKEYKQTELF